MVGITIKRQRRKCAITTALKVHGSRFTVQLPKTRNHVPKTHCASFRGSRDGSKSGRNAATTFVAPEKRKDSEHQSSLQTETKTLEREPAEQRQPIRVMLVDDHRIVREGLIGLIHEEPDIRVVAEATSGNEAIELTDRIDVDVVVMDVTMAGMNGVEATHELLKRKPDVRVIALSMHDEADMAKAMYRAGATEYLSKNSPFNELIDAIRRRS